MATINVEETTRDELKVYCRKQGLTQGDFVKFALAYFKKSGINPSDSPQSVKEELAKIEKRISQVIAFQKTFERNNLLPLLEALTKTEMKVNGHLSGVPEVLSKIQTEVSGVGKTMAKLEQSLAGALNKIYSESFQFQETMLKHNKDMQTKINIILEYGSAAGMGDSIISKFNKKNK